MSHMEQETSTRGVDPSAIERQLTEMWRVMTEDPAPGQSASVMRACILNLVACSTPSDNRSELEQMLDQVTEATPCRAFVLILDPDSTASGMEAYVSSRCHLTSRGAKQVCCEQITIRASGASVEAVSSAVAPLLVSDVPVFLWWDRTPDPDDPVFERLRSMADRLIVDSGAFGDPCDGVLRLSALLADTALYRPLSDVNWGRLTSWRTLVAGLWDVADYRPFLAEIDSVGLCYDPPSERQDALSAKALLGIGWLASRLGWRLLPLRVSQADRTTGLVFQSPQGREIDVRLSRLTGFEGKEGPLPDLRLISSGKQGGVAEFRVRLKPEGKKLQTTSRLPNGQLHMDRVLQYEPRSEGVRLAAELAFLQTDRVYEQAVHAAAEIVQALRERGPG